MVNFYEKMGRRAALITPINETATGIAVTLVLKGLGKDPYRKSNSPQILEAQPTQWFSIENEAEIGYTRAQLGLNTAEDWKKKYGCDRSIILKDSKPVKRNNGQIVLIDRADPGVIHATKKSDIREVVAHEMSHACKPDKPTLFEIPIQYEDVQLIGYHGLAILVKNKDGSSTNFAWFEEGIAERNAKDLYHWYTIPPTYRGMAQLTREKIPTDKYPNATDWIKTNDVPSFVRAFLNLPNDHPIGLIELENAMFEYTKVTPRS